MDAGSEAFWAKVGAVVVSAVLSLFAWVGKRQVARIDKQGERIDDLEKAAVSKEDITQMETRITNAINTSTAHVTERLGDVKQTADKAHERIDDHLKE